MIAVTDRYRALRPLPSLRGTRLFQCTDRLTGELVVLKSVEAADPGAPELLAEGRRLEDLRHPGLVRLVERWEGRLDEQERPTIGHATAWVDGDPLTPWSRLRTPMERLATFAQVAATVRWLHNRGWLHLDLKPENILGTSGRPIVLDLGSARPLDTLAGTAGGTLGYSAPEVVRGEAPSRASDVFSLGAVLYEMMAGRPAFMEEGGSLLRAAVLEGRITPLPSGDPAFPASLARLVHAMLESSAAKRVPTVDDVLSDLSQLGVPVETIREGEPSWYGNREGISALLERLPDLDEPEGAVLALVGPPGIGRSRFARQLLAAAPRSPGAWHLDLAAGSDNGLADLVRFLALIGAPARGPDDPRLIPWLTQRRRGSGLLLVGHLDRWPRWEQALAETLLPAVAKAGWTLVVGSERLLPWARPHAVLPLGDDAMARLAGFMGVGPGPERAAAVHAAQGVPGDLLDAMASSHAGLVPNLVTEAARRALALPDGTPDLLLEAGPIAGDLQEARAQGWLRRRGRRLVPTTGAPPWAHLTPDDVGWVQEVLDLTKDEDPLWRLSLAARAGIWDLVRAGLRQVDAYRARPELRDVAARLAATGDIEAQALQIELLLDDKRHPDAELLLDAMPAFAPETAVLRARVARDRNPVFGHEGPARWRETFGWHPAVAAAEAYGYVIADRWKELSFFLDVLRRECPDALRKPLGFAARLALAIERHREEADPGPLDSLLAEIEFQHPDLDGIPRIVLYFLGQAYRARRDFQRGNRVGQKAIVDADREGNLQAAIAARTALASQLISQGQASQARSLFQQAESLALAVRDDALLLRIYASLAEVEIRTSRLPAAERHLHAFDQVAARLPAFREAQVRRAILWASLDAARGRPESVVDRLRELDVVDMPMRVRAARDIYLLEALIEMNAWSEAFQVSTTTPATEDEDVQRRLHVARARIHFSMGRYAAERALEGLPAEPDPLHRESAGRALLAAAGEDLDPATFATRRLQLQRAAELLPEKLRPRAVDLRERMLDGPAAALSQVVDLIEAMGDQQRLLESVARIVAEVLGANRVLVMLKLPGLGRQVSALEISGQEAAGLAAEIFRRLNNPNDVWQADDAFADPNLRRMSATVRTFQIRSVVAVAIPKAGRVIGALYVDDLVRAGRFGQADVGVLQRLASAIGQVADQIPTQAREDGLVVHDVVGVYLCDDRRAARLRGVLDDLRGESQANILITGPTGVGKTWTARRIATEVLGLSGTIDVVLRPGEPDMLVSALSGTQRGEFTGAIEKVGAVRRAVSERKALFLDEIQNLGEVGQRVLLPLLELPRRRFGGLTGDVRELDHPLHVILGTNADIEGGRWRKMFREDLWYRISANRLDLPPLAERGREAVYRHLGDALQERGLPAPELVLERGALAMLATHPWPGNLRTLTMAVDRITRLHRKTGRPLGVTDVDLSDLADEVPGSVPAGPPLQEAQSKALLDALEAAEWVQADAARALGLSKFAMHRLLKKLNLLDQVNQRRNAWQTRTRGP
jgi:transcriptional regulator with GAF, ATPase, and Fis domain